MINKCLEQRVVARQKAKSEYCVKVRARWEMVWIHTSSKWDWFHNCGVTVRLPFKLLIILFFQQRTKYIKANFQYVH